MRATLPTLFSPSSHETTQCRKLSLYGQPQKQSWLYCTRVSRYRGSAFDTLFFGQLNGYNGETRCLMSIVSVACTHWHTRRTNAAETPPEAKLSFNWALGVTDALDSRLVIILAEHRGAGDNSVAASL